jgi:hypothetical protein
MNSANEIKQIQMYHKITFNTSMIRFPVLGFYNSLISGVLTVNIEFMWLGTKRVERLAKARSFPRF